MGRSGVLTRLSAVAASALAASACAREDDLAPALDTRPPPALAQRFYPPEGWSWGLLQATGGAPHRYGVGGPRGASRGAIVILPGFGEPAEAWFETARGLIDAGWTVWILDLAGQGGSARSAAPRDMAHVRDMAEDAAALRTLVRDVVRPTPEQRVAVVARTLGARAAIMALADGVPGVDAAVLTGPTAEPSDDRQADVALWARRLGFGARFAWSEQGWASNRTLTPLSNDPLRAAVSAEWMRANPPLRLGGVSWAWRASHAEQAVRLMEPARLRRVNTPVTVISPGTTGSDALLCRALPRCALVGLRGSGAAPHLETDAVRDRWLAVVLAAAEGAPLSPTPPGR